MGKKVRLRLHYKTDGRLYVKMEDSSGQAVTGGTGSYILKDPDGNTLASGSMTEEANGWYYHAIADDIAVTPGDICTSEVTMSDGTSQCFAVYEIYVETDRR